MRLVYIDDVREGGCAYFSGVMIEARRWLECKQLWSAMLGSLAAQFGFRTTRELHATKLLSGHGHYFERRPTMATCIETHRQVLRCIAAFPNVKLFLSCGPDMRQMRVFERLITRVNRTAKELDEHAILVCDEGKTYDDLVNTLRLSNPIVFTTAVVDQPLTRIVEDIVYRNSARSFMVQAADATVYTFFRNEDPLPRLTAGGFGDAYAIVNGIVAREAAPGDPGGIIRC